MISCPIPKFDYENILLAHGGGGKLNNELIQKIFVKIFDNKFLNELNDSSVFTVDNKRLAFTTDSYVVQPLFFPGGNIGELAVNGTVNDLSVSGAVPKYLSAGFIIEEGLSFNDLWRIVVSMKEAADSAGVKIITGDTKVVEKGSGDGLFINTAGIGEFSESINISPSNCKPGDKIILNGSIGDHGIAILSAREGLKFESNIVSDSAPLNGLIKEVIKTSSKVKMMRDVTRGGLASTLNEVAAIANIGMEITEKSIPVKDDVLGACEILGFDPFYIANEGKLIIFVDPNHADDVLSIMRKHKNGFSSNIIGEVVNDHPGRVVMNTLIGTKRIVDMATGEQLPRIC